MKGRVKVTKKVKGYTVPARKVPPHSQVYWKDKPSKSKKHCPKQVVVLGVYKNPKTKKWQVKSYITGKYHKKEYDSKAKAIKAAGKRYSRFH